LLHLYACGFDVRLGVFRAVEEETGIF